MRHAPIGKLITAATGPSTSSTAKTNRESEKRPFCENLAWLSRFTLLLMRQHPGCLSLVMKRRSCGWNDSLTEVLTSVNSWCALALRARRVETSSNCTTQPSQSTRSRQLREQTASTDPQFARRLLEFRLAATGNESDSLRNTLSRWPTRHGKAGRLSSARPGE